MDVTEATTVSSRGLGESLRRRLGAARPRRAVAAHGVLLVAAFLLGAALSAVVFVGVWRHTAAEGDKAQAARVSTDHRLTQALAEVRRLKSTVAADQAVLARARRTRRVLAARLTTVETANATVARRLPGQLADVETLAGALARQSASLASALSSLQTYLAGSGTTVDPGFLSAQVRYLRGRSDEAHASASRLQSEVAAATSTVSGLARAR